MLHYCLFVLASAVSIDFLQVTLEEEGDSLFIGDESILSETAQEELIDLYEEIEEFKALTGLSGGEALDALLEVKNQELEEINQEIAEREIVNEECKLLTDCRTCLQKEHCVWCNIDHICYLGNDDGPENQECSSFESLYCDTPCTYNTSMESCVVSYSCLWCYDNNLCSDSSSTMDCGSYALSNDQLQIDERNAETLNDLYAAEQDIMNDIFFIQESLEFQNDIIGNVEEESLDDTPEENWDPDTGANYEI